MKKASAAQACSPGSGIPREGEGEVYEPQLLAGTPEFIEAANRVV